MERQLLQKHCCMVVAMGNGYCVYASESHGSIFVRDIDEPDSAQTETLDIRSRRDSEYVSDDVDHLEIKRYMNDNDERSW